MANATGCRAPVRRLTTAALIAALAVGVAVGCAPAEVPAAPADEPVLVLGSEIYAANCVSCHGASGGGGVGTKLDDGAVLDRYPDIEAQAAVVRDGVRAMPAFGKKLSDDELVAVVRYTREVLSAP